MDFYSIQLNPYNVFRKKKKKTEGRENAIGLFAPNFKLLWFCDKEELHI